MEKWQDQTGLVAYDAGDGDYPDAEFELGQTMRGRVEKTTI